MKLMMNVAVVVLCACAVMACDQISDFFNGVPVIVESEHFPGGEGSVSFKPFPSYMLPIATLPERLRPDFYAGKALANQPWVKAPTVTSTRDGLGPIYNARTCLACHANGGRGRVPLGDSPLFSAFVRISLPGFDPVLGVVPDPVYGDQLQGQSVALSHQFRQNASLDAANLKKEVLPEAYVFVDWEEKPFVYSDGDTVFLRYPTLRIENLGYGDLSPKVQKGLRNAPAIHGVGLLELINQSHIDQYADPLDEDGNGVSGRVNKVWDFERKETVSGRFGWKANRANLKIVTAAAFAGDVGITNALFPKQPCTEAQRLCQTTPNGNDKDGVELPDHLLELVTNFSRNIGVPKRRNSHSAEVKKGRALFYQAGCSGCHVPSFVTRQSEAFPHLSGQTIWPYSDLLLHDMGPALADGRSDYLASGSEWRTPPLWGIGLSKSVNGSGLLLHDGRAQNVEEAILWHGGEAEKMKQAFADLSRLERGAMIRFVESL